MINKVKYLSFCFKLASDLRTNLIFITFIHLFPYPSMLYIIRLYLDFSGRWEWQRWDIMKPAFPCNSPDRLVRQKIIAEYQHQCVGIFVPQRRYHSDFFSSKSISWQYKLFWANLWGEGGYIRGTNNHMSGGEEGFTNVFFQHCNFSQIRSE